MSYKKNGFSPMFIILAVVLVLGISGGLYFYLSKNPGSNSPQIQQQTGNNVVTTKEVVGSTESAFGKIMIKSDVTTSENCGSEKCFEDKFKVCEPATLLAESSLGSIYYEIVKKEQTGCAVKMKYTVNPNPEWVNKEMTCTLDNKTDFQTAIADAFNKIFAKQLICTGPLYEVLSI